jgi:hypothetical protein
MKIEGKTYITNKVLGQKFFIVENEYPFICNPYDVKGFDAFFEKYFKLKSTSIYLRNEFLSVRLG